MRIDLQTDAASIRTTLAGTVINCLRIRVTSAFPSILQASGGHQARRVLSAFTSAWVYMNMHDCGALVAIHQQSVQHATTIRLAADLHSGA